MHRIPQFTHAPLQGWAARRRRGSTLPLVLALLALLGTVATALVYTSRLDAQAATNAGLAVKARIASTGGLAFAMAHLPSQYGAPTNPAYAFSTEHTWLAVTGAGDLSACINLNEVAPYEAGDAAATSSTASANLLGVAAAGSSPAARAPAAHPVSAPTSPGAKLPPAAVATPAAKGQRLPAAAATPAAKGQSPRAIAAATVAARGSSGTTPATGAVSAPREKDARAVAAVLPARLPKTAVATPTPGSTPAASLVSPRAANGQTYTLPASVLERFLATRLAAANFSPSLAAPLAHAMLAARDAMPEGRFCRTADLLAHVPMMTPPLYRALSPFLVTSSSSLEVWRGPDGNGFVPVPVNTASADEILATLRTLYPNADLHLLRQFAANIVDRRDADNIPTVFDDEPGALPILGYEQTVVISEVVPDVATPSTDGDHGEYVEIHNPLSVAVDLTGWRLSWAGGGATLDGSLAAGAYLIVTDDIRGDHDPDPQSHTYGIGSFYDVFHILPTGSNRLVEVLGMDLPDDSGVVTLYDAANHPIDYLSYTGGRFNGLNRGFEKTSPFCRVGRATNAATPFSETPYVPVDDYESYCWQQFLAGMDTPFACETDLLYVPTAYLLPGAMQPAAPDNFPLLSVGQGLRPDLQLADAFTAGDIKPAFDGDGALLPCIDADIAAPARNVSGLPSGNGPVVAAANHPTPGADANAARASRPGASAQPAAPRALPGAVLSRVPSATPRPLAASATPSPRVAPATPAPRTAAATPTPTPRTPAAATPLAPAQLAAPRFSQGKINLNTAPADVLAALPGLDAASAALLSQARADAWQSSHGATGAFSSFAAFADHGAIWAGLTPQQHLDALRALRPYVTVNSTSFLVSSTNRREPLGPDEKAAMRVTSLARVELGAGARANVAEWNFVKP